ncbi:MAG: hypothetical protein NTY77_14305 [Elusimicrobia bacterium]|nr:hypothetical protein [Elusimicrobiota bacterium]
MNLVARRLGPAALALVLALPASAVQVEMHIAPRAAGYGVYALPALSPSLSAPSLSLAAPSLLPPSAAALAPTPIPVLTPAIVALAPAAAPAVAAPATLTETLQQGLDQYGKAQAADPSGAAGASVIQGLYEGRNDSQGLKSLDSGVLVNDEGVGVFGKAAAYYKEIQRTVEKLKGRVELGESLDVMDDAYGDVWSKLKAVEAIAQSRNVEEHNTHLDESLVWVDGVMRDHGRNVAIQTHRVYFHHSANPQSEIAEGTRRVDKYLDDALKQFSSHGRAEKAMGVFDEVILAFDTRGYQEIKEHLQRREAEVAKASGGRYRFVYLDDLVKPPASPEAMRADLNVLTEKYRGKGLDKIIEGVIYSRYVGLLLELKTLEHYLDAGYKILQSGRELFDERGMYVTELDAVVQGPDGKVSVVEAKSARVALSPEDVLREKVLAKLDCYTKNRALLEKFVGSKFDEVVFSFDVGRQPYLAEYLKGREAELSKRYGVAVRFLFLQTGPAQGAKGKHRK